MPITNVQMALKYTPVCLFKCIFIKFNKYIFIMIILTNMQNMHQQILVKLTK